MKRTSLHSLEPSSARKKIAAAKSNKPFMAALLDRDHRGHKEAVEQWTRLHEAGFPEAGSPAVGRLTGRGTGRRGLATGGVVDGARGEGEVGNRTRTAGTERQSKSRLQEVSGTSRAQGPEARSGNVPILNMESDRIQVLLQDAPARFEIAENPGANPNYGAWRSFHRLAWSVVRRHEAIIEREAEAQGVDADLVKAIMYVENVQGLDSQIAEATGVLESESLLPMNIRPDPWAAIESPPADLADPATNIRIAVTLIGRIAERIDDPTPAKVASVWNFTGRESVNDFGERVGDVYERRMWALPVIPTPELDESP